MSVLIKNGRIITAEREYDGDIFIENEVITEINSHISKNADTIIDAKDKYVIPGGIDVHTHLDMPLGKIVSSDDFETGTRAAAFGGTTTIIDFATQSKGMEMIEALDQWQMKADGKAYIDYGFHMIITDLPDMKLKDLDRLVNEGVTSFKLFMAYPDVLMVDDATILKAMKQTSKNGGLICIHAEDGHAIDLLVKQFVKEGKKEPKYHALSRPPWTEAVAISRSIALARQANVPVYFVHVSTSDGVQKILQARNEGLPVYGETCPQYLFLSIEDIDKPDFEGAKYVFTPPVREQWHQEKLWEALKSNSLQVVSTDHCPFNFKGDKEMGRNIFTRIPNGGPGIEHRVQLIFEGGVNQGKISLRRWVEITSTNPAKLFGLYPKKGTIGIGSDADIVVWDPNVLYNISADTHHMRVDYSMYEGKKIKGNVVDVILRGSVIILSSKWVGKQKMGKFIKRKISLT